MIIKEITDRHVFRILTSPFLGREHSVYSEHIRCAQDIRNEVHCPFCDNSAQVIQFWLLGCIDRQNNECVVYKVRYNVFYWIRKFANDRIWGDPTQYDLEVDKDYNGLHAVTTHAKKELTQEEQLLKEKFDCNFLKENCKPCPQSCIINYWKRYNWKQFELNKKT